jgi:spore coat polysaccharide biosynthesis protein SpsF
MIMEEAERHSEIRITLDTADDYAVITEIFEGLYPKNPRFGFDDVVAFCQQNPELLQLNRHIVQKTAR